MVLSKQRILRSPMPNQLPVELLMISFAGSDATSTRQGGDKRKSRWQDGWWWAIP